MDMFRQWTFSLCAAGVISAIIEAVSPRSGLSKLMRMVTSLFMLLCIVLPISRLTSLSVDLSDGFSEWGREEAGANDEIYDKVFLDAAQKNLEELLTDKLRKMGINPIDIRINISISEDEIAITDVELLLPSSCRDSHDSIRSTLQSELGLAVKIGYQ